MISINQIKELSKAYKISESVIAREYFQLLFLNELYSKPFSNEIFFKGGTCIRLIYGGKRFSEDLDFTVNLDETEFNKNIEIFFKYLSNTYPLKIKGKDTLIGKSFLLTATLGDFKTDIYIKLDFSFRENVIEPTKIIMNSEYPIITSNYVFTLSKNELIAEKVRAIMSRKKLRDIYDLWIILELGGKLDIELINQKLKYYNEVFDFKKFIARIDSLNVKDFITDLRPFVPFNEREKLEKLFGFVVDYCKKSITAI